MTSTLPAPPKPSLPFTGERLIPNVSGAIELEHLHRYALASFLATGKTVLDIASGEGYGSNLLARSARTVFGVDIAPEATQAAQAKYPRPNLHFITASGSDIPLANHSIDLIASFETIEHLAEQDRLIAEFRRVLRPSGILVISTPNKAEYSDKPNYHNPFHVQELYLHEFHDLLKRYFPHVAFFGQRITFGSLITPLDSPSHFQTLAGSFDRLTPCVEQPLYYLALASDAPIPSLPSTLFDGTAVFQRQADERHTYENHMTERVRNLQLHADNLQADLQRARERVQNLQLHADNLQADLQYTREHTQNLQLHADNLQADLQRTRAHVDQVTTHSSHLESALNATTVQLQRLTSSRYWRTGRFLATRLRPLGKLLGFPSEEQGCVAISNRNQEQGAGSK